MAKVTGLWIAFLVVWGLALFHSGAVEGWSVALAVLALAALNIAAALLFPDPLKLSKGAVIFLWGALAVFVLQFLPIGGVPFLFGHTQGLRETHGVGQFWPATADTYLTLRALLKVLAVGLSALLVLKLRREGLTTTGALKGVVIVLSLEAVYGMIQVFSGERLLPFYDGPTAAPRAATGTLIGRNNFAGMMAIGLVLATGLAYRGFLWPVRRSEDEKPTLGRRMEAGLGWALMGGLMAVAIVLSKSRGASLSAMAGLVLIPFLYRGRGSVAGLVGLVLVVILAVFVANPEGLLRRFEQIDPFELSEEHRLWLFSTTIEAGLRQPLLGFGVGTHPHAFHPFQPPEMSGQIHHAHNEYVNVFFEGGFLWLALLVGGLGFWFWRVHRSSRSLHSPDRLPVAAVLAAVAAEAIHSMVDFDLRVPAAGMLFGVVLGLGSAVCRRHVEPRKIGWTLPGFGVVAAGILLLLPLNLAEGLGEKPTEEKFQAALGLSPYNYNAAWRYADATRAAGDQELIGRRFETATALFPAHPQLQMATGLMFWGDFARSGSLMDRDRAATCFNRLFRQRPQDVELIMKAIWDPKISVPDYEALLPPVPRASAGLAAFLVSQGQWTEGMRVFNVGAPANPESVPAYDHFARALHAAGQWGMEAQIRDRRLELASDGATYAASAQAWTRLGAYDTALKRITTAIRIQPADGRLFAIKGNILMSKGKELDAVEAYTEAVRYAPGESAYRLYRGRAYTRLEMHAAAADDYAQLRRRKPDDRSIMIQLARALDLSDRRPLARQVLTDWLASHPDDPPARKYLESLK